MSWSLLLYGNEEGTGIDIWVGKFGLVNLRFKFPHWKSLGD